MAEKPLSSPESELSLLGGLMLCADELPEVAAVVGAADFVDDFNRRVWSAMLRLSERGVAVDLVTVADDLEADGGMAPTQFAALGVMARDTPSAANVINYARIVRRFAVRRRLAWIGNRLSLRAMQEPDPEKILAELSGLLEGIGGGDDGGMVPIKALLVDAVDTISRRFEGVAPRGMDTGLADLDKLLHGLHDGDLVVVAGRPGMGKSALGMQFADRVALAHDRPVAVFTAEMPSGQQVERMLASRARLDLDAIRTGALDGDDDWGRLTSAVAELSGAPVWMDETGTPDLADVLAKARKLHRRSGPLGLVLVDHAGLVDAGGENRQQSQAGVAKALKALAKELGCPVVALVQLNRKLEERSDRRPLMSDLRESGEWEQSADVVLMIYRDEVYDEKSPDKGCAELLVRKHRNGALGTVPAAFVGRHSRFESLAGGLPSKELPAPPVRSRRGIDF